MTHIDLSAEEAVFQRNAGQLAAFQSEGNCVVLAGPGSGKTRVLAAKVVSLVNESEGSDGGVCCITYSNECRIELQRRLSALGLRNNPRLFVGTVHGYCLRHIILPFADNVGLNLPLPLSVASDTQRAECGQVAVDRVIGSGSRWQWSWDSQVERFRKRRDGSTEGIEDRSPEVSEEYVRQLRSRGLIDFDDITNCAARIVGEHDWTRSVLRAKHPAIAIDEYQDLGGALHDIVLALMNAGVRFFVVGDPDQCIYEELQEARPELLDALSNRADVECIRLKMNYRAGTQLVRAAASIVDRGYLPGNAEAGEVRHHSVDAPSSAWGPRIAAHSQYVVQSIILPELANGTTAGDVGVLVLNKEIAAGVADRLSAQSIRSIRLDRGLPYERTPLIMWIASAVKWCSIGNQCEEPTIGDLGRDWRAVDRTREVANDTAEWERLVVFLFGHVDRNRPLREWLAEFDAVLSDLGLRTSLIARDVDALNALKQCAAIGGIYASTTVGEFMLRRGSSEHVTIVTLHSAKGLEFPVVVMPMMDDGVIPHFARHRTLRQQAEQRRLFYVGVTRASRRVHITN
jgi:DNA helicase II / ATP-dependent DNA helicase PcrA